MIFNNTLSNKWSVAVKKYTVIFTKQSVYYCNTQITLLVLLAFKDVLLVLIEGPLPPIDLGVVWGTISGITTFYKETSSKLKTIKQQLKCFTCDISMSDITSLILRMLAAVFKKHWYTRSSVLADIKWLSTQKANHMHYSIYMYSMQYTIQ